MTQPNIKAQMQAADLLIADFLALTWKEEGSDYSALRSRYETHWSALQTSGPMLPQVVMHLFAKLEERALHVIGTWSALTQTDNPNSVADMRPGVVPAEVLRNINAVHEHLPKVAQSRQAQKAASGPRPGGHHNDRQRVINELKKRLGDDPCYFRQRGQKAKFNREMLDKYPEVKRENTIRDWVNEHLNALGRLTP